MKQIHVLTMALCATFAVQPALAQQRAAQPAAQRAPAAQAQTQQDTDLLVFRAWDKDHDNKLTLEEFRAGRKQARQVAQAELALRQQFNRIDANHNGGIDTAEYGNLELIKKAGRSAPPMSQYDANRDGRLSFGEYLKLVEALAPKPAQGQGR